MYTLSVRDERRLSREFPSREKARTPLGCRVIRRSLELALEALIPVEVAENADVTTGRRPGRRRVDAPGLRFMAGVRYGLFGDKELTSWLGCCPGTLW